MKKRTHALMEMGDGSDAPRPMTSLSTFIANAFYDVFIQDDDEIFKLTFSKNWSRHVEEVHVLLLLPSIPLCESNPQDLPY